MSDGVAVLTLAADDAGRLVWADSLVEIVLQNALAAQDARAAGRSTAGIPTGLPGLDRVLNGLQANGLYVLAGAPGIGKTTLALQWACHAAREARVPVLYLTFENTPQNLTLKTMCRLARIAPSGIERGREPSTKLVSGIREFNEFAQRVALMPGSRLSTTDALEQCATQVMARHGASICLVVVDYLQRMAYRERYDDLRENVSALSMSLRQMANHLSSPVLALSSLSWDVSDPVHPSLEALSPSGDLEYAADAVLLLGERQEVSLTSAARIKNAYSLRLLELQVAKNRYGEAGSRIPLMFNAAIGDFDEETG